MAINMKKRIAIVGIVVFVLLSAVTCDEDLPEAVTDEITYTNVEYSKDGSQVKIWLDGSMPVPVKKSERAMSKGLAEMAFDFLEVIFVNGAGDANIARASWEIGEPAGISGVDRGTPGGTGVNYSAISGTTCAAMFVGKSASKVLLGIGKITLVNDITGTTIDWNTGSVTFSLGAIQTGLLVTGETVGGDRGVLVDSFVAAAATSTLLPLGSGAVKQPYPVYTFPLNTTGAVINYNCSYKFDLSASATTSTWWSAVMCYGTTPKVQPREPRFVDGGAYRQPKDRTDTKTKITLGTGYTFTDVTAFNSTIPLIVAVSNASSGLLSFNLEIPVYMVSKGNADKNQGPKHTKWVIRTGYGPDFYNLDDGVSSGGCVLLGVGASQDNWINIDWEWL